MYSIVLSCVVYSRLKAFGKIKHGKISHSTVHHLPLNILWVFAQVNVVAHLMSNYPSNSIGLFLYNELWSKLTDHVCKV